MPRSSSLGFLLLVTLSPLAGAQDSPRLLAGPRPSPVLGVVAQGPLQQPFAVDSVGRQIRPTHWKTGALIGGLAAGIGLALYVDGFCRSLGDADDCGGALTAGFLTGGVLGGLLGALIGGQFPKDEVP